MVFLVFIQLFQQIQLLLQPFLFYLPFSLFFTTVMRIARTIITIMKIRIPIVPAVPKTPVTAPVMPENKHLYT